MGQVTQQTVSSTEGQQLVSPPGKGQISPHQALYKVKGKKVKVKRTCIAPFVKLQLRYGSHRVAPANYTIPASTLRTFARYLNGRHMIQLATHLSTPEG